MDNKIFKTIKCIGVEKCNNVNSFYFLINWPNSTTSYINKTQDEILEFKDKLVDKSVALNLNEKKLNISKLQFKEKSIFISNDERNKKLANEYFQNVQKLPTELLKNADALNFFTAVKSEYLDCNENNSKDSKKDSLKFGAYEVYEEINGINAVDESSKNNNFKPIEKIPISVHYIQKTAKTSTDTNSIPVYSTVHKPLQKTVSRETDSPIGEQLKSKNNQLLGTNSNTSQNTGSNVKISGSLSEEKNKSLIQLSKEINASYDVIGDSLMMNYPIEGNFNELSNNDGYNQINELRSPQSTNTYNLDHKSSYKPITVQLNNKYSEILHQSTATRSLSNIYAEIPNTPDVINMTNNINAIYSINHSINNENIINKANKNRAIENNYGKNLFNNNSKNNNKIINTNNELNGKEESKCFTSISSSSNDKIHNYHHKNDNNIVEMTWQEADKLDKNEVFSPNKTENVRTNSLITNIPPMPKFTSPHLEFTANKQNEQQNELDTSVRSEIVAIQSYESKSSNVMSFKKGDLARLLLMSDVGWWCISLGDNNGWVPSDYWKVIDDNRCLSVSSTNGITNSNNNSTSYLNNKHGSSSSSLWYVGKISRQDCEQLLLDHAKPHDFIVRESQSSDYVLSVKHQQSIHHFPIQVTSLGKYKIGGFDFKSISNVITYYKKNPLFFDSETGIPIHLGNPMVIIKQ